MNINQIIPFNQIFFQSQLDTLNHCHKFNQPLKFDQDFKKILLHFILIHSCEYFTKNYSPDKILFIQPLSFQPEYEIFKYIDKDEVIQFVTKSLNRFKKILPFPLYISSHPIDLSNKESGETREMINIMSTVVNHHQDKTASFQDVKRVTGKKGLKMLAKEYFNSMHALEMYIEK